jgi:hypothetical protein
MIVRAWSDDEFRETTARAGWERAQLCGSEQDMFGRIIDSVVAWRVAMDRRAKGSNSAT